MATLQEITKFLDSFLEINLVKDLSWNGLQFQGSGEVDKIAFAVDSGIDVFEQAVKTGANMLIVHHGNFWKSGDPSLTGFNLARISVLTKGGISLYCAHLPLDRHSEVGNNAQLLKLLGAKIIGEFDIEDGANVGWIGKLEEPKTIVEIEEILKEKISAICKILPFGVEKIKTIATCSGGGGYPIFFEAVKAGVDLYISGDTIEVYQFCKDAKFNTIFAGHYATETVGVKALMPVLKDKFKVETVFLDLPTGL